jgi:N-[(2S)-2-amino-2-carboxyethyl]-L-glutamate dehydrogenase
MLEHLHSDAVRRQQPRPAESRRSPPAFFVVGGQTVERILGSAHASVMEIVRQAYLAHSAGASVNPPSLFLRFPGKPSSRIIALPAALSNTGSAAPGPVGIKWIASFPDNLAQGLPRASAVLILNDPQTGHAYACVESARISAARTAASAAVAAGALNGGTPGSAVLGVIGCGPIAQATVEYLLAAGWRLEGCVAHDLDASRARDFCRWLTERHDVRGEALAGHERVIGEAGLLVFATTAAAPYVDSPAPFRREQIVLHVSLRDLGPAVIRACFNVTDDLEHCLKAGTSLHLTASEDGNHRFVDGTIGELLDGTLRPDPDRPKVFSPFGMGILDVAVGAWVFEQSVRSGHASVMADFYA